MLKIIIAFSFCLASFAVQQTEEATAIDCVKQITRRDNLLEKYILTRNKGSVFKFPKIVTPKKIEGEPALVEAYLKMKWNGTPLPFAVFQHLEGSFWAGIQTPTIVSYYDWVLRLTDQKNDLPLIYLYDRTPQVDKTEYRFITNHYTQQDADAMKESLVFNASGELVDVREILEIRIHFYNQETGKVIKKEIGKGLQVKSTAMSSTVSQYVGKFFGHSFFKVLLVVERLFKFSLTGHVSTLVQQAVTSMQAVSNIYKPVYIEFFHTQPTESMIVEGNSPNEQIINTTFSGYDHNEYKKFKAMTESLNLPIVLSSMSGLAPERFTKEYLIIPNEKL